jgi:glycosyltransferase involved in cell wall biosynthesis
MTQGQPMLAYNFFVFYSTKFLTEVIFTKSIDLIVPCFNEQEVLNAFYTETQKVIATIKNYSFNYIFIDDGSSDNTLNLLKNLAFTDKRVKYISFSKNFGKEAAMYAGLKNSTGDLVVIIDADLQHPPSLIPTMLEQIENGYDCCAAKRSTRTGESRIRSFFSRMFYRLNNKITDVEIVYGAVDFRMMTRQMVEAILRLSEVQRFSKGIFSWVGFDTKWIPYENIERTLGTTKWSFWGLCKYAIDGITSFSTSPLRMVSGMGFIISTIAIIYIIQILIQTLAYGIDVPGYASTIVIVLFIGGIIELSIGVLGEYIARIYMESKKRPIFITKLTNIDEEVNDETNK